MYGRCGQVIAGELIDNSTSRHYITGMVNCSLAWLAGRSSPPRFGARSSGASGVSIDQYGVGQRWDGEQTDLFEVWEETERENAG